MFSWIAICGFALSRVIARFAYLECHLAFSEQCVAKLVHVVLLLYLAVSSPLAIGSCLTVRKELQSCT